MGAANCGIAEVYLVGADPKQVDGHARTQVASSEADVVLPPRADGRVRNAGSCTSE